jgi:uncharacterized protein YeaO (DUF488 family)
VLKKPVRLFDRYQSVTDTIVQLFASCIVVEIACGGPSQLGAGRCSLKVEIKRVYEEPGGADGTRILVDRLWPRGLSKERARVDLWLKDIAPSTELRKWFSHDPSKWTEFQARYRQELKSEADLLDVLRKKAAKGPITLLYGAKDEVHNEAVVLQSMLQPK